MTLVILLCLSVAIALALTLPKRSSLGFLLSPAGLFTIGYCSIYFIIPLLGLLGFDLQIWGLHSSIGREPILAAAGTLTYFAAAIVAMHATRVVHDGLGPQRTLAQLDFSKLNIYIILLGSIMVAGAVLTIYLETSSGIRAAMESMGRAEALQRRITLSRGWGYLRAPVLSASALLILIYLKGRFTQRRSSRLFLALAVLGVILLNILAFSGFAGRLPSLIPILYLAFAVIVLSPREKILRRLLIGTAVAAGMLVLVAVLGQIRRSMMGAESQEGSVALMDEIRTSFGQAEHLVFVLDHRHEWIPARGATYVAGLLMPIPRTIWPDKPVGGGPMLANIVRPGSYDLGQEINSSRTTGAPLEAYLNFEFPGLIFIGAIHGLCLAWVTRYGTRMKDVYQLPIYFISLFAFAEMFLYGEFAGVLTRYGSMVAPILLIGWILRASSRFRRVTPGVAVDCPQGFGPQTRKLHLLLLPLLLTGQTGASTFEEFARTLGPAGGVMKVNASTNEIAVTFPLSTNKAVRWALKEDFKTTRVFGLQEVTLLAQTNQSLQRFGSQTEFAFNLAMRGEPPEDVGGLLHGNERKVAMRLHADREDLTLPFALRECNRFSIEQDSEILFGDKPVGRCRLKHTWEDGALSISHEITFDHAVSITNMHYSAMWPLLLWDSVTKNQVFDTVFFNGVAGVPPLMAQVSHGTPSYAVGKIAADGVVAFSSNHSFFACLSQPEALLFNDNFERTLERVFVAVNPGNLRTGNGSQLLKIYFQALGSGRGKDIEPGQTIRGGGVYRVGEFENLPSLLQQRLNSSK